MAKDGGARERLRREARTVLAEPGLKGVTGPRQPPGRHPRREPSFRRQAAALPSRAGRRQTEEQTQHVRPLQPGKATGKALAGLCGQLSADSGRRGYPHRGPGQAAHPEARRAPTALRREHRTVLQAKPHAFAEPCAPGAARRRGVDEHRLRRKRRRPAPAALSRQETLMHMSPELALKPGNVEQVSDVIMQCSTGGISRLRAAQAQAWPPVASSPNVQ